MKLVMVALEMSVLIVIPTYNEWENIAILSARLRDAVPHAHLLIVDDGSPDGTGALADRLSHSDPAIHVLHRQEKDGLGRAYVAGFGWGIDRGYERLLQMDADLSHDAVDVARLLERSRNHDLVLGSRYVRGGGTRNWGRVRRALSRFGSIYARHTLGLPFHDLTGGFKCWHRATLIDVDLETIQSNGYSFQIEMTHRAASRGHSVVEEPILFTERASGRSKMSHAIIWEAMVVVWRLRRGKGALPAARPLREPSHAG